MSSQVRMCVAVQQATGPKSLSWILCLCVALSFCPALHMLSFDSQIHQCVYTSVYDVYVRVCICLWYAQLSICSAPLTWLHCRWSERGHHISVTINQTSDCILLPWMKWAEIYWTVTTDDIARNIMILCCCSHALAANHRASSHISRLVMIRIPSVPLNQERALCARTSTRMQTYMF